MNWMKNKKIIDISMPIHEHMATYKGRIEKRPSHTWDRRMPQDSINESSLCMNLHTGTHLDAHLHMIADGWTIKDIPLERLITPCKLFDLTGIADAITRSDLEGLSIAPGDFVLLKTQNSAGRVYDEDFVYIRHDAAEYLAELKVSGVGIDALGVERDQPGHLTHMALMSADVLILEGLALRDVQAGSYYLIALPLSIPDAEGAPVRAVLLEICRK
jgi:arylformamidase